MPSKVLNDNDWATIKLMSQNGLADMFWSVGDTKTIKLNGTCGLVNFDNFEVQCYILGFNHNADKEGKNLIHFQIGKVNGVPISLTDGHYGGYISNTVTSYTMNLTDTNTGGWASSHMRNDIIGNGNVNNNQYIFNDKPSSDELSETTLLDVQFICNGIEYQNISTKRGSLVFMPKTGPNITVYNGSTWTKPEYRYITVLDNTDLSSIIGVKNSITKIQSKCVDNLHYTFNNFINTAIFSGKYETGYEINFTTKGNSRQFNLLDGDDTGLWYVCYDFNTGKLEYSIKVYDTNTGQWINELYKNIIFETNNQVTAIFNNWLQENATNTPLIFVSCLPDDLKQNMSYVLKYTDNVGDDNESESLVLLLIIGR